MRADETALDAVAVFGSSDVAGTVEGNMATVFGSSKLTGEVEENMATVFGSSMMTGKVGENMATVFGSSKMDGQVGGNMVTVFGDTDVNGTVDGNLVTVFGSLKLGSNAVVNEGCVAVFGRVDRDPHASLANEPFVVLPWFGFLTDYIRAGPFLGRPLPPGSLLAWIVVALHFVLYFLVALVLPKPTAACVRQLDQRFLASFGMGLLVMPVIILLMIILSTTVIGIILIPFIIILEIALAVLGTTATLQFFGLGINRRFSGSTEVSPALGFLTGFGLVTLLYMVPVVGGLLWLALRPPALGAAVLALFGSFKRNGNGAAKSPAEGIPVCTAPPATATPASFGAANMAAAEGQAESTLAAGTPSTAPALSPAAPADPAVTVMPRAGFWIRLAATTLDFVLLVWLIPFVQGFFPFVWLGYHVAMWSWRGTTIGGLVCSLKLVRVNGQPVNFGVALVRGLASVFSTVVLFLGFFWAGWTRQRQSWHDIIAGTVMVRAPKTMSLI